MDAPVLRKIKGIFILVGVAAVGGMVAALSGVDYLEAFGPFAGAAVAAGVGYLTKEAAPKLIDYLRSMGEDPLPVPPVVGEPVDHNDSGGNVGPDGGPLVPPGGNLPPD
jgi:hypothetical protein